MTSSRVLWTLDRHGAVNEQKVLRQKLRVEPLDLTTPRNTLAVGVAYNEKLKRAVACAVPMGKDGRVLREDEYFLAGEDVDFPYIPGLFAYREGPAVTKLLESLPGTPGLLVLHAQGIAHPRRFGLAAHIGVLYDVPSIGFTRKRLTGQASEPPNTDVGMTTLRDSQGVPLGVCVRLMRGCDPIYASPGHRADLNSLRAFVRGLNSFKGCLPEALCMAQEVANRESRRPF